MRQNALKPNLKKTATISLFIYSGAVYGTMAMMSIAAGLVMLVCVLLLLRGEISLKAVRHSPLFLPTLALSLTCIVSLLIARFTGLEYYGFKPDIHFIHDVSKLWHLWFNLFLFAMIQYLGEDTISKSMRIWLGFGLASAIFGIVQYYFPIYNPMLLPHVTYENYVPASGILGLLQGRYHATGLAGFHLSFASIFAFPTGVWLALSFKKKTPLLILGSVLFLITNILTYSKTTWGVIPAMLIGFFVIGLKGPKRIIMISIVAALALLATTTSEFKMRFQGVDTIKERRTLWQANFDMIEKFPIFGVGWHHNADLSEAYYKKNNLVADGGNAVRPFISHAHNNFIDQLASTGVVGLLSFLWWNIVILFLTLKIYRRDTKYRVFALGMLGGWFCLHLGGLTQTNFWDAKVMHQLSWVTAMTLTIYHFQKNHSGRKVIG